MASGGPQVAGAWGFPLRQSGAAAGLQNAASLRAASYHGRPPAIAIDDDSDGSDEGDAPGADVDALRAAIFGDYGEDDETDDDAGVAKIRALLVAGQSGGTACLICLERVRVTDFVWDCKSGCYGIFHLTCLQSWARQSLDAAEQRAQSRPSAANFSSAVHWYCPKCRAAYPRSKIPKEYVCFCGKQANPVADPWLAPHTCGEKCGRQLEGDCGHQCTLLCHPGPCPPCPQLRRARCFCEKHSEVRRCGRRHFSCGGTCGKRLPCENHTCEDVCHEGNCPPCTKLDKYACRCKRETALRMCTERDFRCKSPCGRELGCGKHSCEEGCHAGSCGDCKLAGRISCPCGKEYRDVSCDQTVPTCGSTCEKVLGCSIHKCQERCHFGPCNTTCRVMTSKACHCGSLKKLVPCYQDLQCERKCQRLRDCTRHSCRKRCCNGDCPPCSEVCARKLRCGNHKCPAPCHRGVCAPCPVSVKISCACGLTSFEVPCGMERNQKPPRCSKPCRIPPRCSHGANCKPHACHYGDCPPCQLVCNSEMSCGHKCPERCHGPRPEPNQEYSLKPSKKKKAKLANGVDLRSGSPCPPCMEPVVKQCLGQHYGIEKTMICSAVKEFQCGNLCGNLLSCGNHSCTLPCHPVRTIAVNGKSKSDRDQGKTVRHDGYFVTCDQCLLQCEKKRALCSHPCPLPCHPGECPPCKALIKRSCYCKTLVHAFDCDVFSSSSEAERAKMLSCRGPCHRKLPNCSHMCSDICHPGPCQSAGNCRKKVAVRCACQRLKKEWLCLDTQAALSSGKHTPKEGPRGGLFIGLVPCDEGCLRLAAKKRSEDEEAQQLRRRKWKEAEVAAAPRPTARKRKMRRQTDYEDENTLWQGVQAALRRWSMIVCVVVLVVLMIYFAVVGLMTLNTWMNEREIARMRRRRLQYSSRQAGWQSY